MECLHKMVWMHGVIWYCMVLEGYPISMVPLIKGQCIPRQMQKPADKLCDEWIQAEILL